MSADAFKNRTKTFAVMVIRLVEALPQNQADKVIRNWLLRSGTSVGANYRIACRAKSPALVFPTFPCRLLTPDP